MSSVSLFDESRNELGEGLLVDEAANRLYWVDIVKSKIFSKDLSGGARDEYLVDGNPSALLYVRGSRLFFCSRSGLASIDVASGQISAIDSIPGIGKGSRYRANDGTVLHNGNIVYGTMEESPIGATGAIYGYDGVRTIDLNIDVGIPNGFVCLDNSRLLIADSLQQRIDLYVLDSVALTLSFEKCWHDFSEFGYTPDGGCLANDGYVYFALWDGFGIAVLDGSGKMVRTIELPVPRPTNCKMAGSGRLFVTSARDGLSDQMLREYPLSGSVFVLDL